MKTIYIPESDEFYDENTNEFFRIKETKLTLEHSLVSVSKWESIWHIAYLTDKKKTTEQVLSYIECMTITQNVDKRIYKALSNEVIKEITEYINNPMTASSIVEIPGSRQTTNETVTSELIYYWMFKLGIPKDCEKWHLNRLLTLIKIYGAKEQPPKKMSKNEILKQNNALNAKRRARMRSRG